MHMLATVVSSDSRHLLVRDFKTKDEVLALFQRARAFKPGDCVRIEFDRKFTGDLPHMIIATSIWEIECPD